MKPVLKVVICATRPGRIGDRVARWFADYAARTSNFDVQLVDLRDFALPVYDEPHHPRLKRYENAHTKIFSAAIEPGDAFVFVLPEYNTGPGPAFVNALTYLYHEWAYKPCGFVSYGGISGGLRGVQIAKQLVSSLKMMPLIDGVPVPFVSERIADGRFVGDPKIDLSADKMLPQLLEWAEVLKSMREKQSAA